MSHFYGIVKGQARTQATRRGSPRSGLTTIAASWAGAIEVTLWTDEATGQDMAMVEMGPWHGKGTTAVLYRGPVNDPGKATNVLRVAAYREAAS